ncbi:biosynthetic arginine decarboxylase [Candidatus Providencia siddallii]|uniref:Arginine decarboxylase n=1 Tax=Candidatus Providencia siddallii TaxID=1715285 RepID=A0ABM9NP46_9GAMM
MNRKNDKKTHQIYNISYWSNGYYQINEYGNICVCPDPENNNNFVEILNLINKIKSEQKHLQLPTLLCFPQILQHRLRAINTAFKNACKSYGYKGDYLLVYPIKVNQQSRVIKSLLNSGEPLGLESGSKAELVVILANVNNAHTVIICNGYKDKEYIRLALIGEKIGHKIYLVIEKMSEIELVLKEAKKLNITPRLGVRARLASQGSGKWQASGGEKSKFGLSATQVLQLVEILRKENSLNSLQLLHFHLGSQMSNIRDVATGVRESARFYIELHRLGVNIKCFDVGGGLGVDYEGTRSQSDCSVNYGLNEYTNNVIWSIGDACEEFNLPHPIVITESGRALTAHHAVLISNVIGIERNEFTKASPPNKNAPRSLISLWETWKAMQHQESSRNLREWLHDSQFDLQEVHTQYAHGTLDLNQRAWAEELYLNICRRIKYDLNPSNRTHRPIIDELQERMADKFYVNFSLFQSLPDSWGIDQVFPILPIKDLFNPLNRRVVLLDITCDSDGIIDHYIDGDGIETTMPIHDYDSKNPPIIGFFMIGAYQEILANKHNLFGSTTSIDIWIDNKNKIHYIQTEKGDSIADILQYVNLIPEEFLEKLKKQIKDIKLEKHIQKDFLKKIKNSLHGYSYLKD